MTGKHNHKLCDRCRISWGLWMWCWRAAQTHSVEPLTSLSLLESDQRLTRGIGTWKLTSLLLQKNITREKVFREATEGRTHFCCLWCSQCSCCEVKYQVTQFLLLLLKYSFVLRWCQKSKWVSISLNRIKLFCFYHLLRNSAFYFKMYLSSLFCFFY